jgi:hypothetical protein
VPDKFHGHVYFMAVGLECPMRGLAAVVRIRIIVRNDEAMASEPGD